MKNYHFVGPLLAIVLPLILFESLRNGLFEDPQWMMPRGHFYIVSAVALLSSILAILVGIAGRRVRNIKVSFLALAFISLAQLFLLHGLSTPHFILPITHVSGAAAQLSILLASIWLWLSSLPSDHPIVEKLSNKHRHLLPFWVTVLSLFDIVCMFFPHVMNFIPIDVKPLNVIVMSIVLVFNISTFIRYYQTYRFSKFPLQLAIVYCAGWFMVSQFIMMTGEKWKLSWWIYHFLLLASMLVMIVGLIKQYSAKGTLTGAIRALFTTDPFERITGSASPRVKALVISTEQKDVYTVGHTFRVTMYALRLAEALHVKPEQLRALSQGALVHDVGKTSIPDAILNKPGKLSGDERIEIEQHPLTGYEICRDLGFMREELSIIRSHHEKWDGTGYPDRLKETEIPFLARIVAVVDVYDALTSERSYREAWPHMKAIDFLLDQKGTHFDPICVDAWVRLCERDPSVYQYPSSIISTDTAPSLLTKFLRR